MCCGLSDVGVVVLELINVECDDDAAADVLLLWLLLHVLL